ncbi:MAG: hypothetical protein WC234_02350 [Endomicrobiaceae bacterium]
MNINKFFYILFASDIIVAAVLSVFLNLTAGIITACVLLFINILTFVIIKKIQKVQKRL